MDRLKKERMEWNGEENFGTLEQWNLGTLRQTLNFSQKKLESLHRTYFFLKY